MNNRLIPDGCHKADVFYNLYVLDQQGNVVEKAGVSNKLAYGMVRLPKLKPGSYTVKVVNWRDASTRADFLLTAYAADQDVQIDEASDFLLKDLNAASPTDVLAQSSGSVQGFSYLNNKTNDLTISLKKSASTAPFDAEVKVLFQTEGALPWDAIKSNYEWQSLAKGEMVKARHDQRGHGHDRRGQGAGGSTGSGAEKQRSQSYQLTAICPKQENICVL